MKKTIVVFGSSSDIAQAFIRHNPQHNIIEFSSKDGFDLSKIDEPKFIWALDNKLSNINKIDEIFFFNGIPDRFVSNSRDLKYEEIIKICNINFISFYLIILHLKEKLVWAFIFTISSARSIQPWTSQIYAASKAALNNLVKSFAISHQWNSFINIILGPVDSKNMTWKNKEERDQLIAKTINEKYISTNEIGKYLAQYPRIDFLNGSEIYINCFK